MVSYDLNAQEVDAFCINVLILVVVEDGLVHAVEENNKNRKDES